MIWRYAKAVLVLPVNVLIVIPGLIFWLSNGSSLAADPISISDLRVILVVLFAVIGLGLGGWTMALFARHGDGTPAPWDPPRKLVVRGPYRHVRNPMISGVVFMLAAEAVFFQSWPIAIWAAVFFIGNSFYFPFVEEPGLEKRFGEDYRTYRANVPRWIPRANPFVLIGLFVGLVCLIWISLPREPKAWVYRNFSASYFHQFERLGSLIRLGDSPETIRELLGRPDFSESYSVGERWSYMEVGPTASGGCIVDFEQSETGLRLAWYFTEESNIFDSSRRYEVGEPIETQSINLHSWRKRNRMRDVHPAVGK